LQINDNGHLGLPGMRAIADSPHLTSLKELDVSNNSLSAVALQPILDGPPANRLFRLILTENRLGDAGVAALVASPVFARMAERDRVIDLRRVEMGPAGARSLAASPALRHVESLDLEGNMLGDAGLAAIAASPHLTQIRVLNLHGNRIGDLTNNMITQESQDRLHEAKARFNWRGELQLKVNSKHNLRSTGLLAAFVRRPIG
jgi:Leucine-rich repeat (LRR) protein